MENIASTPSFLVEDSGVPFSPNCIHRSREHKSTDKTEEGFPFEVLSHPMHSFPPAPMDPWQVALIT